MIGFSSTVVTTALIRPFTGSGANAVLTDVAHTYGGSSHLRIAAVMIGSTKRLYVVMIYFAASELKKLVTQFRQV